MFLLYVNDTAIYLANKERMPPTTNFSHIWTTPPQLLLQFTGFQNQPPSPQNTSHLHSRAPASPYLTKTNGVSKSTFVSKIQTIFIQRHRPVPLALKPMGFQNQTSSLKSMPSSFKGTGQPIAGVTLYCLIYTSTTFINLPIPHQNCPPICQRHCDLPCQQKNSCHPQQISVIYEPPQLLLQSMGLQN